MHSGHRLVVGSAGGSLRACCISRFIGFTTKKNTVAAIVMNVISELMKLP